MRQWPMEWELYKHLKEAHSDAFEESGQEIANGERSETTEPHPADHPFSPDLDDEDKARVDSDDSELGDDDIENSETEDDDHGDKTVDEEDYKCMDCGFLLRGRFRLKVEII